MKGRFLWEILEGSKYGYCIVWIGDKLRVDFEIVKGLFKVICDLILEYVYMIL